MPEVSGYPVRFLYYLGPLVSGIPMKSEDADKNKYSGYLLLIPTIEIYRESDNLFDRHPGAFRQL